MTNLVIPIDIVGPEKFEALGMLNPNAFPKGLRPSAMACADQLALTSYSIRVIRKAIYQDLKKLIEELHGNPSFKDFVPNPQKPTLVICRQIDFQAGVQSFFITIKSVLDIYARIVAKAIMPESKFFGFGKKKFKGRKIPGGCLLNFLERSVPRSCIYKEKVIEIIVSHIDDWISDVVDARDAIVHDGVLKSIIPMHVPMLKKPHEITEKDIILPSIQKEGDILGYCHDVRKNIGCMLKETLVLLPSVDTKLLAV